VPNGTNRGYLMKKTRVKKSRDTVPLIRHKDIGVLIFSGFFDSAHLFTVTGLQFLDSA
jgi:hypothetical protein